MLAFIVRRLLSTVLVMAIVAVFIFLLLHLSPGDPAAIIVGDNATQVQIDAVRKQLGLDDPLAVQFVRWIGGVLSGDLGVSIFSHEPVEQADRPAHRADRVAGDHHAAAGGRHRGVVRGARRLEGRDVGRPRASWCCRW